MILYNPFTSLVPALFVILLYDEAVSSTEKDSDILILILLLVIWNARHEHTELKTSHDFMPVFLSTRKETRPVKRFLTVS